MASRERDKSQTSERQPLLQVNGITINRPRPQNQQYGSSQNTNVEEGQEEDHQHQNDGDGEEEEVEFSDSDPSNPRNFPFRSKASQVLLIFLLALLCPMSSSSFAPAVDEIAADFGVGDSLAERRKILAGQTGFVCFLGLAPLFWAPMSETFGRRGVFLTGLTGFTVLQVGTCFVGGWKAWIVVRTLSGLFGSVGVANGGGSISDMFERRERAVVLGVYLVAPLLGPTLGPLLGGLTAGSISWRWIFGILAISSGVLTLACYFFLFETNATVILQQRKRQLEKKNNQDTKYTIPGTSDQSVLSKVASNSTRAVKILLTQPIVMIMSLYQALVFSSMFSLYSQFTKIWSPPPYNFSKTQVGLAYLGPAVGFIITAFFIVLFIDKIYGYFAKRNGDDGQPEYRLPMANVGAIFLPISLFWFGWTVEAGYAWPIPLAATLFFGASQVSIFNTVQTYYIDAFESQAASALAAGAFMRSIVGGVVPLFVTGMFDKLGYGLGISVFGILGCVLMPAPILFYWTGRRLREKFPFEG